MNNTKHRSPFAIAARLIVLVRPMLPCHAGSHCHGCHRPLLRHLYHDLRRLCPAHGGRPAQPLAGVNTAFVCILVFALLRGVLRYAEQASNTISPSSCWPHPG